MYMESVTSQDSCSGLSGFPFCWQQFKCKRKKRPGKRQKESPELRMSSLVAGIKVIKVSIDDEEVSRLRINVLWAYLRVPTLKKYEQRIITSR